jgi:hypothetical protein
MNRFSARIYVNLFLLEISFHPLFSRYFIVFVSARARPRRDARRSWSLARASLASNQALTELAKTESSTLPFWDDGFCSLM